MIQEPFLAVSSIAGYSIIADLEKFMICRQGGPLGPSFLLPVFQILAISVFYARFYTGPGVVSGAVSVIPFIF